MTSKLERLDKRFRSLYKDAEAVKIAEAIKELTGIWIHEISKFIKSGDLLNLADMFRKLPGTQSTGTEIYPLSECSSLITLSCLTLTDSAFREQERECEDIYENFAAKNNKGWFEVFKKIKWDCPNWSHGVRPVAAFMARGAMVTERFRSHTQSLEAGTSDISGPEFKGKKVSYEIAHMRMKSIMAGDDRNILMAFVAGQLHDFPFWIVGRQMYDAALRTKPPEVWNMDLTPMPFKSMTFVVPKGMSDLRGLTYSADVEITHLFVHVVNVNELRFVNVHACNRSRVITSIPIQVEDGACQVGKAIERLRNANFGHSTGDGQEIEPVSRDHIITTVSAAVNLCLIASMRPELMGSSSKTGTIRSRKSGQVDVRTPRTIGASYKRRVTYQSPPGPGLEPSGKKVVTHWRAGHIHTVSFGKGRQQKKEKWFEPILVNPPDGDEG